MDVDLLARIVETQTAVAGGPVQTEKIELIHCAGTKWVTLPFAAKTDFRQALLDSDERIRFAMDQLAGSNPAPMLAAFKTRFEDLYDRIFSSQARDILHAAADAAAPAAPILRLHLMPGLDVVPWELLYDGKGFLGLRFQIARLPVVPGGPPSENGTAHEVRKIVSVLAESVLDAPEEQQWRSTFDGFATTATVWRKPDHGDWPTVNDLDGQAIGDVVHVTCHGILDAKQQRYWSLNHAKKLDDNYRLYTTVYRMFQVAETAPLVFANACASAVDQPDLAGVPLALGEGFGTTFYDNGARGFVGTFAPVSQAMAVGFAKRFFQHLFADAQTVGESLVATKADFLAENPVDPSFLFYCHYGDPSARFTLATN